jgi:hypothetical protein
MKNIFLTTAIIFSFMELSAQTIQSVHEKDSCATSPYFQTTIRATCIQASQQLLLDTSTNDATVIKYAQFIIANPQGVWLLPMSYGALNNPSIDCNSDLLSIQYQINYIFAMQAYAYFQIPPPPQGFQLSLRNKLNMLMKINKKN